MHPSEAARQERLEDRPGLIEACDPTVPIDERWAVGFLQSPLDGLHLREQVPRVAAGDECRPDDVMAAEDRRFPPRARPRVTGRFRIARRAAEILDRDTHRG